MPDKVMPGPVQDTACIREAVCIHTRKIFDCCKDKDIASYILLSQKGAAATERPPLPNSSGGRLCPVYIPTRARRKATTPVMTAAMTVSHRLPGLACCPSCQGEDRGA